MTMFERHASRHKRLRAMLLSVVCVVFWPALLVAEMSDADEVEDIRPTVCVAVGLLSVFVPAFTAYFGHIGLSTAAVIFATGYLSAGILSQVLPPPKS